MKKSSRLQVLRETLEIEGYLLTLWLTFFSPIEYSVSSSHDCVIDLNEKRGKILVSVFVA